MIRNKISCIVGLLALVAFIDLKAQPSFSKSFSPSTIGPGSVSTLSFTINNASGSPVMDLAFTDVLPAGVTIANVPNIQNTCVSAVISAPAGGTTISFSGGSLGANQSCTISVNVTSSTTGTHMNVSGDLTSSAGNSGTATDDLTVNAGFPGFTKSFSPSTINLGEKSRLTFTIENGGSAISSFDFTDILPAGMLVANPPNASVDGCSDPSLLSNLSAIPGTNTISLNPNLVLLSLSSEAICNISLDVISTAVGQLGNISGNLSSDEGAGPRISGKASAVLTVNRSNLHIQKEFIDDPVSPGDTAQLKFTITNFDRNFPATDVAFSDDLDHYLAGATFEGAVSNSCGGMGGGTTVFSYAGGSILAGESCMVVIKVAVPSGTAPGIYPDTSSTVSGTVDGSGIIGNKGSDRLFVEPVPILTKEFIDDPVGAGNSVTLRFTILNTSLTSGATDIAFIDELTDNSGGLGNSSIGNGFLPFPVNVGLPPSPDPPCGAGSSMALISLGTDRQGLSLTGGNLAQAGMPGDHCTFDVTINIPIGFPQGEYTNTTEEITATIDGATRIGKQASDKLIVVAAPRLQKEFIDDPAIAGGTATLQFTLTYDDLAPGDATNISFTDDLNAALNGLTATGLPLTDVCGPGNGTLVGSAMDGFLTFSGATLAPGEICTFPVTVNIPAGAKPGTHTNTTSNVTADVLGKATIGNAASDILDIISLTLTKEFIDDPVIAGGTVTLQFKIKNISPDFDATAIHFSDVLDNNLTGLVATLPPSPDPPCGAGSSLTGSSGNKTIALNNGELVKGDSCIFTVSLTVPPGTSDGIYGNITSGFAATIDGSPVVLNNASDQLQVNSSRIELKKEFIDDPVPPGGTATLRFKIKNLDQTQALSAISFSDNLDAALAGLVATGLPVGACGGTANTADGGKSIDFTGGSLAAGDSCMFDIVLTVPGTVPLGGQHMNTTSAASGTIGGLAVTGPPAKDNLKIGLFDFNKSFDTKSTATGTVGLTFTIANQSGLAQTNIAFSDNLSAVIPGLVASGLPANNVCGVGSVLSGTSLLTLTGGNLGIGATCSFTVNLNVPASALAGTYPNTTSQLLVGGLVASVPASASLEIEPPPVFSKTFVPDMINPGLVSTLNFNIDNTASDLAATSLNFTDNLPAGLVIANPSNVSTTCTGGTLTATAGSGVISYTAGTVGAGSSCTIMVDVTAIMTGNFLNTTGDLSSSSGNSGTASDNLLVVCPDTIIHNPVYQSSVCIDDSLKLNETGGIAVAWLWTKPDGSTLNIQNPDVTPFSASDSGTYKLVVTDQYGCKDSSIFHVSLDEKPIVPGDIVGPGVICPTLNNLPYSVEAVPGAVNYIWTFNPELDVFNGPEESPKYQYDLKSNTAQFPPVINGNGTNNVSINGLTVAGTLSVQSDNGNTCPPSAEVFKTIAIANEEICTLADCSKDVIFIDDELLAIEQMTDIFKVSQTIESDANIMDTWFKIFIAGNSIDIYPPFTVEQGAIWQAQIESCMNVLRESEQKN